MTFPLGDELVGATDIARKLGVSRSAPGVWERRHPDDFPQRIATINKGDGDRGVPVWLWSDIEAWCRKTGRLPLQKGHVYDKTGRDITEKVIRGKKRKT